MAKVTSFSSTFGMSMEIKEVWYKASASITVDIEEGDDVAKVKEMAHNTVNVEVEKQIRAVVDSLNDEGVLESSN